MKNFLLTSMLLMSSFLGAKGEVDPNFHIYLCFGQSNMEGNAQWESQDVGVDQRFQMLATCNFTTPSRTMGNWYPAECPIVSPDGKLGPSDYFGRTMVANLPNNKIGVVAVAMGGSPIEMFDKDKYQETLQQHPDDWWAILANRHYGGNPYGRLIQMAQKAQEVGVIKGILLHQGESNCGDPNWPNEVKKIYNDMLTDLGLNAADVPLFAGEVEYEGVGEGSGGCAGHNVQVDRLPSVIPTAHVVSAKNLPGNGVDPWHFSAQGYRIFGQRYAQKVLSVQYDMEIVVEEPEIPITSGDLTIDQRFTSVEEIGQNKFAIVNEEDGKAFYVLGGENPQFLYYDTYDKSLVGSNLAVHFRLENGPQANTYLLRCIKMNGDGYNLWGSDAYLNSGNWSSFVLGLNNQYGQDIANGAVWQIEYNATKKGFALKNVGAGGYLKDTGKAEYTIPTYFTLCTLKSATSGVTPIRTVKPQDDAIYTLDGRKLVGQPTQRGIYIVNGKKVVLK